MQNEFRAWVRERYKTCTNVTDAQHIERDLQIDLDDAFDEDEFVGLRTRFAYSADDMRAKKENHSGLVFQVGAQKGTDEYYRKIRGNLSNYRSTLNAYARFRKDRDSKPVKNVKDA